MIDKKVMVRMTEEYPKVGEWLKPPGSTWTVPTTGMYLMRSGEEPILVKEGDEIIHKDGVAEIVRRRQTNSEDS